jgi:U4/U6 small nuclear ribonucleoprotein PRP31
MAGKITIEINHIHGVCNLFGSSHSQALRDLYRKRFPELEHQVLHPLDYARVVLKLGNNIEQIQELEHILPAANIMAISMSASSSTGINLTPIELDQLYERCRIALELDDARQRVCAEHRCLSNFQILSYVESRMKVFAPNLSEIIGSEIAAKLIGIAGGLDNLAKLPSSTLFLLGKQKKSLMGFATSSTISHYG